MRCRGFMKFKVDRLAKGFFLYYFRFICTDKNIFGRESGERKSTKKKKKAPNKLFSCKTCFTIIFPSLEQIYFFLINKKKKIKVMS